MTAGPTILCTVFTFMPPPVSEEDQLPYDGVCNLAVFLFLSLTSIIIAELSDPEITDSIKSDVSLPTETEFRCEELLSSS